MALTGVLVLELLSDGLGSLTPGGGVTLAVLLIDLGAEPLTVPAIVIVTLPPLGSVGTVPETRFPATDTLAGQTAPPLAPLQLALSPPMDEGTESLKLAPSALLGPALLMTRL